MSMPLKRTAGPAIEPVSLTDMKNHLRVNTSDEDQTIVDIMIAARETAEDIRAEGFVKQSWTFGMDIFPYLGNIDSAPSRSSYGPQGNFGYAWSTALINNQAIILPKGPTITVDSINYYDPENNLQTVNTNVYTTDLLSAVARIVAIPGFIWPATYFRPNAALVNFTIGHQQTVSKVLTTDASGNITLPLNCTDIVSVVNPTTSANVAFTETPGSNTVDPGIAPILNVTGLDSTAVLVTYNVYLGPSFIAQAIKLATAAWYENREEFYVNQASGSSSVASLPIGFMSLLNRKRNQVFGYTGSNH